MKTKTPMLMKYVDRFMERKDQIERLFRKKHPATYNEVVRNVLSVVINSEDGKPAWGEPDFNKMTLIDHGDYQGTQLYVMPEAGYQPYDYFYVRVSYGSCSGCDTLQAIRDYRDDKPDDEQVRQYMQLALNVVQGLRQLGGYGDDADD